MHARTAIAVTVGLALAGVWLARSALHTPAENSLEEKVLREYTGVYRWGEHAFVYLQLWNEFSGFDKPSQLVAFDESGDVRVLYPEGRDRFVTGSGAAVSTSVEARVEFRRDESGKVASLTWRRGADARTAHRIAAEKHEDVRFSNGDVQLTGTLITPASGAKHPAVILVHGSGPENREYVLPFARFLVRRGVAVLGYDKRGVGGSSGDWKAATFDDLAGDVVAAFEYLRTRQDIDPTQIGFLGVSQAGWVMPLAALRAKSLAFLISVSGAGVTPAETTLDQTQNELTARGMKPETVRDIIGVMKLQYQFAETGRGWDDYLAARGKLAARLGRPPDTFPDTPNDPHWDSIRRFYFYDPAPVLRQLTVPALALFGELDSNIVAEKNRKAWEGALRTAGTREYRLMILPKANHLMFEANIGSNAEIPSLRRFVPEYFSTVEGWLGRRIRLRPPAR